MSTLDSVFVGVTLMRTWYFFGGGRFFFGMVFLPIESLQQTQNDYCTKSMTLMITKLVSVQQYDCKNEAWLSEIPAVQNDLQRLGNRTHDAIKPGRGGVWAVLAIIFRSIENCSNSTLITLGYDILDCGFCSEFISCHLIKNTFWKMKLMCTMRIWKFFLTKGYENGLYYGKNDSSRFVNRLYYAENDKNTCFSCFFWKPKKQKLVLRS